MRGPKPAQTITLNSISNSTEGALPLIVRVGLSLFLFGCKLSPLDCKLS